MTKDAVTIDAVRVRIAAALGAPARRLEITHGVEPAARRTCGYREGAICPRAAWRSLDEGELASVLASEEIVDVGRTVELAPAPDALLLAFAELGFVSGRTESDYSACLTTARYPAALRRALPALAPFIENPTDLQLLGVCVQSGNLRSTTTHTDPGAETTFSGLHVDNWDRLPLGERRRGRRQLCINVGAQDRFFVFARCDVDAAVATLGMTFDRRQSYIGIACGFFTRFPEAALIKLRVRPGEMYIAPTDNLIHDGTSLGTTAPDLTLNLRGHFRGPCLASLATVAGT